MKILHVTHCYSAGVGRAIDEIARATPSHEHVLLRSGPDRPDEVFIQHKMLPQGPVGKVRCITQYANEIQAHIIFAHSSFGGFFTRVVPREIPVIYQPHCFAFHDINRPAWLRNAFFHIERILARRTAAFLTLNNEEREAVKNFSVPALVKDAYNKSHILLNDVRDNPTSSADSIKHIVMVGRLTSQKNPFFFAEVANLVTQNRKDVKFTWIGDGEERYRAHLAENMVVVTGWLDQRDLREKLGGATMYLHSADYEGFPISVLDAAALRVPIIVRSIPCFEGQGLMSVQTAGEASRLILELLVSHEKMDTVLAKGDALMQRMPPADFGRVYDQTFEQVSKKEIIK